MSLQPVQMQNHKIIQIVEYSLDDFLTLWQEKNNNSNLINSLELYFSPTKSEKLKKEFVKYINNELYDLKNYNNIDSYLSLVLSFQFTAPLLNIIKEDSSDMQNELIKFRKIMKNKYGLASEPRMKFDLTDYRLEDNQDEHKFISEEEAMRAYVRELDENFEGQRSVKDAVYSRLKKQGMAAINRWQHEKKNPSIQSYFLLSEAFGRSIVIPSFFSFKDDKMVDFYRKSTNNIYYFIEVPESII